MTTKRKTARTIGYILVITSIVVAVSQLFTYQAFSSISWPAIIFDIILSGVSAGFLYYGRGDDQE